ncbi:MAG: PAS domain S-box protein [Gemmatimonadetes bacterium]|nr:PAS domain S-box protein [Gemmatimonadota bacterium]
MTQRSGRTPRADAAARSPSGFAQPPLASVEWDAEGRVTRWSPEAEALFGWPAGEVMGRRASEWPFVHPDDAPQVRRVSSDLREGRARQTFSANRNLTRDGRVLHCEWYNTAVTDAQGHTLAQLSLVLDVTERVLAEQRAERAAARTRRLQSLTRALSEALTPPQVVAAVMDHGIAALEADAGVMVLVGDDGEHLELVEQRGYPERVGEEWRRFPLSAGVPIAEAVRQGEIVVVASREERDRRYPQLDGHEVVYPVSLSVPLVVEGERLGAMGLGFRETREFSADDRALTLALARQCAQAIRRARLFAAEARARAAAERARAALAEVFRQAPVAICVTRGPGHVFELANPLYRELLGGRDPTGRPVRQVLPEVEGQGLFEILDRVYASGRPFTADAFRIHYDRAGTGSPQEAFFNLVYHPLRDEQGTVTGLVTVATEVTEQVQARRAAEESERQFRTMAESIPQLAWMADASGSIFWYNQRWYDYTGTTLETMRGWGWQAVHDPEQVERVTERFRRAVQAEEPWEDTFPLRGRDGTFRRFLSRALPVRDDEGRVVRWFGTNTDVEEQLRAEEARAALLREAQAARGAAEEANRAKSVFLATMSHEIRTPINAVIGYADLLDMGVQGGLSEGQRAYLARIRASSQHLLGLVNDVLDFAKIEAGEMGFDPRRTELRASVAEAVAMVAPQAGAAGVALREEPCPPGAACLADPDRVRQILLNLLSNAIKFTRPGGRITVRCVPHAEPQGDAAPAGPGPWACIQVRDTGIGIPAEQLARVFEPFTQVDDTHTREAGGTGLGLAISRRFARLMGGELTARSQPGEGSSFSLWLPAAPAEAEAEAGAGSPAEAPFWPAAAEVPGLRDAGRLLEANPDRVVQAWARRVYADPGIPHAHGLDRARLEDHTPTLVMEIGRALTILDATGGAPLMLRDGESIQRTLAQLHGVQRARLGFAADEIRREYAILVEEMEELLRRELPARTPADPRPIAAMVRRIMDRVLRIALESHAGFPGRERVKG